jgi:hypothetical protein
MPDPVTLARDESGRDVDRARPQAARETILEL